MGMSDNLKTVPSAHLSRGRLMMGMKRPSLATWENWSSHLLMSTCTAACQHVLHQSGTHLSRGRLMVDVKLPSLATWENWSSSDERGTRTSAAQPGLTSLAMLIIA